MRIDYDASSYLHAVDYLQFSRTGAQQSKRTLLLHENTITVSINGKEALRINCTPGHLRELVVGHLFTSGIIGSAADVQDISLDEKTLAFQVVTAPCPNGDTLLQPYERASWKANDIFALADDFAEDTPLHHITSGTHSCRLVVRERPVMVFEDAGRHNAMDKLIGYALLQGINLHEAIVFTSGRIPVDMATKAVRAKLGVLASKAAPTDQAVSLARAYGLVIIRFKESKLQVY